MISATAMPSKRVNSLYVNLLIIALLFAKAMPSDEMWILFIK
jgi:hypothetical protein